MTAKQLLLKMPDALDASAAAETTAVVQYEISEPVHHVLDEGELEAREGRADEPDLTVTIEDGDLVALFGGELDPMAAYMTGRLRVEGDMTLAQRLVGLFDRDALTSLAEAEAAAGTTADATAETTAEAASER
jgi:putative sterol carrier protein